MCAIRADAAKAALPGLDSGWGDDLPPINRRN